MGSTFFRVSPSLLSFQRATADGTFQYFVDHGKQSNFYPAWYEERHLSDELAEKAAAFRRKCDARERVGDVVSIDTYQLSGADAPVPKSQVIELPDRLSDEEQDEPADEDEQEDEDWRPVANTRGRKRKQAKRRRPRMEESEEETDSAEEDEDESESDDDDESESESSPTPPPRRRQKGRRQRAQPAKKKQRNNK